MDDTIITPSPEYAEALRSEAQAYMDLAEGAYASAVRDVRDRAEAHMAAAEALLDSISGRLYGEASNHLNVAEATTAGVAKRLNNRAWDHLSSSYKALKDAGAEPNTAMPYIEDTLAEGDAVGYAMRSMPSLREAADRGTLPPDRDPGKGGPILGIEWDGDGWMAPPVPKVPLPPPVPPTAPPPLPPPLYGPPLPDFYGRDNDGRCYKLTGPERLAPEYDGHRRHREYVDCATVPAFGDYGPPRSDAGTPLTPPTVPPWSPPAEPPPPPASPPPPGTIETGTCPASVVATGGCWDGFPLPTGKPVGEPSVGTWEMPTHCETLSAYTATTYTVDDFINPLKQTSQHASDKLAAYAPTAGGIAGPIVTAINRMIIGLISGGIDMVGTIAGAFSGFLNRTPIKSPAVLGQAVTTQSIAGWAARISGAPVDYLATVDRYNMQWAAPQYLPSQDECDNLYMTNRIDKPLWECWTRAQGNIPAHRERHLDALRVRPGVREEIALERRGYQNESEMNAALRGLGVTSDADKMAFYKLSEEIPTASDLIRYMVRDSFDEQAVATGGYDNDFGTKFLSSDKARAMAKAAGISEERMRYEWRAHWAWPSNTQMMEMIHRLRPGKDGVGDLAFSVDDYIKALQINDMAPGMTPRMAAVSYNTITRTDLLQWLTNGTIEPDQVVSRLMDTGYNEPDAQEIVKQWMYEVKNRRANRSHVWTRDRITKEYVEGTITMREADRALSESIPDQVERDNIIAAADSIRSAQSRKKCIHALKRRFLRGEFDEGQAYNMLLALGVEDHQATFIMPGWVCELATKTKIPTLGLLKKWYGHNLISTAALYQRLRNLQYTDADANTIISDMSMTQQEVRGRQAQAELRALISAESAQKRLTKEREKELEARVKAAEQAAERQRKEAEAARKTLEKASKDAEKARAKAVADRRRELDRIARHGSDDVAAAAREAQQRDADAAAAAMTLPPTTVSGSDQP